MTTKAKSSIAALALLAALGLGASSAAQAGHEDMDVFWSIAMSQPGIRIGVSNVPAAPVVVHERHHVYERPVYVPPPRVVYLPPHPVHRVHPGYYGHGHGYGHGRGHWNERHDRRDDRHQGRRDDRGRGEHHAQRGGDRGDRGHGGGRGPEMHMGNRR
ncbi:MAG: hypothetical protein Q8R72_17025 [Hylemonella sp.]|nr:hypothetical protein [Hylemonella sp.]